MSGTTDDAPVAWRAGAWIAEVVSVAGGLVEAYVPGRGVDARTREQLVLAVADSLDADGTSWVHRSWLAFLGDRDAPEEVQPLLAYAHTTVDRGVPVDVTVLAAMYEPHVVRATRAAVGLGHVSSLVDEAVRRLARRARRRLPWAPVEAVQEVVAIALVVPAQIPIAAVGGVLGVLGRLAPTLPPVHLRDGARANLVAQLLAESLPTHLGHAAVRAGVAWSPVTVSVAFRSEEQAATVSVGRREIAIVNGVEPGAVAVVEGGLERLLPAVAASLLRDLGTPLSR